MKKHLIRGLIALFLLSLLVVVVSPRIRWKIHGWCQGERFYQGLPTSYWSGILQQYGHVCYWPPNRNLREFPDHSCSPIAFTNPPVLRVPTSGGRPMSSARVLPQQGSGGIKIHSFQDAGKLATGLFRPEDPWVPDGKDPAALPVLLQLLHDVDPDVQLYSVLILGCMDTNLQEAVPHLQPLLRDGSPDVGREAAFVLCRIQNTSEVLSQLKQVLGDSRAEVRRRAIDTLCSIGRQAKAQCTPMITIDFSQPQSGFSDPSPSPPRWFNMSVQLPSNTMPFATPPAFNSLPRPEPNWATDRVISILSPVAANDSDTDVRKAASEALKLLSPK